MSKSPFADEPGFLSFEEFYLLPIGTEVETIHTHLTRGEREIVSPWTRGILSENPEHKFSMRSGDHYPGDGWHASDAGLLPYADGKWNASNYTRLATPQPPPTKTVAIDKLTSALNDVIAAVEKVKEIVNE